MTESPCVHCGRPCPDGYADTKCARELADALLVAAGHAEDAEATLARQARYGTGSRGGSDDPLPGDLAAAAKLAPIANTIGTWARVVTDHTGRRPHWRPLAGPLCPPWRPGDEPRTGGDEPRTGGPCTHDSCDAIRRRTPPPPLARETAWLARQADWLRKHPAAGEAFSELHDACDQLARLVDGPADRALVGICDCGRRLYALDGRTAVQCVGPTCKLVWDVNESRQILRKHLGDKLVTIAEAARLSMYLDSRRTQDAIRKLLASRAASGQLAAHGIIDGEPVYLFAEAAAVLASIPTRERRIA